MNKQIFFLSGMFRCGTNLLRSIMNQNPDFYISPNSFLPEVFQLLHRTKETNQYKDWKKLDIDINYNDNENTKVAIYCVNTCNGYTELKTGERAPSLENSIILFNANELHRSVSQTNTKRRINININYE